MTGIAHLADLAPTLRRALAALMLAAPALAPAAPVEPPPCRTAHGRSKAHRSVVPRCKALSTAGHLGQPHDVATSESPAP
jgi:hypothetical protein